MKKILAIVAASALTAMAGTAMAGTANLNVTAVVDDICIVGGGNLDFGTLDPTTAPLVNANLTVQARCTNGLAYNVTTDYGANAAGNQAYLTNGTSDIPYSVTVTPTSGTGTGADQDVAIAGSIAAGAYATATAGNYTDTMVLTVAP
jgi:spore coat protein U-like protein